MAARLAEPETGGVIGPSAGAGGASYASLMSTRTDLVVPQPMSRAVGGESFAVLGVWATDDPPLAAPPAPSVEVGENPPPEKEPRHGEEGHPTAASE